MVLPESLRTVNAILDRDRSVVVKTQGVKSDASAAIDTNGVANEPATTAKHMQSK